MIKWIDPYSRRQQKLGLVILAALAVSLTAVVLFLTDRGDAGDLLAQRQTEVAERSRSVMPFDLDRTTHRFIKNDTGGVQIVTSDDDDPEQIRLIREHLKEERERFAAGDFADPATIHGAEMPGLELLRTNVDAITVTYSDLDEGARIDYTAADDQMRTALHAWFDAQVSDHGEHAQSS